MMRSWSAFVVFISSNAFAADKNVGPPDLAITTLLGSLLLVLVCIFGFAYLMKQTNLLKNARGKSQIKVIATQPLTSKGRVQLIEINGQQYLLGVTEQNISLLDKLDNPVPIDKKGDKKATVTPFSILLSKISKKNNE